MAALAACSDDESTNPVPTTGSTTSTTSSGGSGAQGGSGGSAGTGGEPSTLGPLTVHPQNPRYFADATGAVVYLTGSHTWSNLQDIEGYSGMRTLADLGGYESYLDFLEQHHHNFIRLWILEHTWDSDESAVAVAPHPWARTGPGTAQDGLPKFDLTELDQAYLDRLRARIESARARNIYVSIMFFDDWSTEHPNTWNGHPFHQDNNINGIDADTDDDGLGLEFHTLDDPAITQLQETYLHSVIDTVNDLDNVLYEIANETGVSVAWQYHMIDVIKQYQQQLPNQHPVGMTVAWPVLEVDNAALFASDAEWISPNSDGGYRTDPPAATGEKVILSDTDHLGGIWGNADWVWRSFTRGLHPIFMDPLDNEGTLPAATQEAIRQAMGQTLTYAERMDLAAATPQPSLCSTGYVLAAAGSQYLAYAPTNADFTIDLAAGTYAYEWFDPDSDAVVDQGTVVAAGGDEPFQPPTAGPAALYLSAQ